MLSQVYPENMMSLKAFVIYMTWIVIYMTWIFWVLFYWSPTCHKGNNPTSLKILPESKPRGFAKTFNCECILTDFHHFVGAATKATKKHVPLSKPRRNIYWIYKNFDDEAFIMDVSSVPCHVPWIFDDVHDASWFTSSLFNDEIANQAPCISELDNTKMRFCPLYEEATSKCSI